MITITIVESLLNNGVWSCWLRLTDGAAVWMLPVNAPGELAQGDLQAHFDNQAAYLWTVAQQKQHSPERGESGALNAQGGARRWYADNPNASLLFTLSIEDLVAGIDNRTANQETLLLKTLAIAVRVLARREGLI